jgi:MFS family permease
VAWYALLCSGCCCIAAPFMLHASLPVFIAFLLVWGLAVIADSPQFSALVAQSAPPQHRGTALTFITSIGFFITVVSMFLFDQLLHLTSFSVYSFAVLAIGPLLGLISLRGIMKNVKGKM